MGGGRDLSRLGGEFEHYDIQFHTYMPPALDTTKHDGLPSRGFGCRSTPRSDKPDMDVQLPGRLEILGASVINDSARSKGGRTVGQRWVKGGFLLSNLFHMWYFLAKLWLYR